MVGSPTQSWCFNGTMSAQKTNSTVADCDVQVDTPEDLVDISHLHLEAIAPNQFDANQLDAKYEASKYEFWAYCGCYIRNSRLVSNQFAAIAFQTLIVGSPA